MTQLPDNPVTINDLMAWYKMHEDLAKLKASEVLLRKKIFGHYFPTPSEGTNTFTLPDGYALKATYKIERKVDEAALTTLAPSFREQHIAVDSLIVRKPELAVREYRKLTTEQTRLFDQCLIVKPSETPSLEIVLPAKAAT